MGIAIAAGVPIGILMGRFKVADDFLGLWVNLFLSAPLTALVPVIMILFGFGQTTIIVTVVLFAIWIIVLDTRAGVRNASPSLVEMARSFGATPAQLYGKILLLAALPEILTGIRLGVIRGVKGVVIGQLLVSIVGLGELFELYSRSFLLEQFWALTLILFAFAILLAEGVAMLERRVEYSRARVAEAAGIGNFTGDSADGSIGDRGLDPLRHPAPPVVALPVAGEAGLFPVRRVYCVGRNYAEHAREMGHDPDREEPFFFTKPADALATDGRFPYPPATKDVHHEIELVVALGKGGRDSRSRGARLRLGLRGRPRHDPTRPAGGGQEGRAAWEVAKAFDASAPISPLVPVGPEVGSGSVAQQRVGRVPGQMLADGPNPAQGGPQVEPVRQIGALEVDRGDQRIRGPPAAPSPLSQRSSAGASSAMNSAPTVATTFRPATSRAWSWGR